LPVRHAARTAAAASRLSSATTEHIATRSAEQVIATLGELKGGATKPGQAMSVFEAALPENIASPYRSPDKRARSPTTPTSNLDSCSNFSARSSRPPAETTLPTHRLGYVPSWLTSAIVGSPESGAT
jgi:hypothetical protein